MNRSDELGPIRRIALVLIGLMLMGGLSTRNPIGWLLGVFGLLVVLAASGIVELGMALFYRRHRRRTARRTL